MLFRSTKADAKARPTSYNDQIDLDVASNIETGEHKRRSSKPFSKTKTTPSPDLNAIWNELMSMKVVVEEEHDRKLRRIESDLRWTMTLVGAHLITIIGAAIAMLAGQ